jgi:hypothetical protein
MGFPSPQLSEITITTTAATSSTTTNTSTECTPATKTARLIEEYKQHAAEWAAEEGDSYVDVQGFSSSSRAMMIFKGGNKNFLCTAPFVEDGTEAAFHRFLEACTTQQQVEQVQKQHQKNLIQ